MEAVRNRPISDALRIRSQPLTMFLEALRVPAATVFYRFGPFSAVLAKRSEDVEHVLVKNHENYVKGRNYEPLKLTLGNGLVTSEGELWKRQRKVVQPAFHQKSLRRFAEVMADATEAQLEELLRADGPVDIHAQMMRLTFRIVGLTLFSTDVEDAVQPIGDALHFLLKWTNDRAESLFRPPLWMPTPGNIRFKRARRVFDELVYDIIKERRAGGEPKGDLLDMLLAVADDGVSDEQLRDELITLAVAGHETTANALSWTFYLLSKHPDVARRVREEADAVIGDRPPTLADVAKLEYTERVVEESMRLYPPVWGFERQAVGEDQIGTERVRPGTSVMIVPYAMHRDFRYWSNPEGFDPDRFLPEAKKARPRFAYLPFGGGPRICIGNAFAMMEAKIIVALIARRARLSLVPGHDVELEPSITLRPKNGILVEVEAR